PLCPAFQFHLHLSAHRQRLSHPSRNHRIPRPPRSRTRRPANPAPHHFCRTNLASHFLRRIPHHRPAHHHQRQHCHPRRPWLRIRRHPPNPRPRTCPQRPIRPHQQHPHHHRRLPIHAEHHPLPLTIRLQRRRLEWSRNQ